MTESKLKSVLLKFCQDYVLERKRKVQMAITTIEESLFEEGKSTAGDKHHTARAMLQIDRENAGKQLKEVEKIEETLSQIRLDGVFQSARLGSLIRTQTASYFLSVSGGLTVINGASYICISTLSPIGQLVLGKKEGDSFSFREKEQTILEIS